MFLKSHVFKDSKEIFTYKGIRFFMALCWALGQYDKRDI